MSRPKPIVSLRLSFITSDGAVHTHRPEPGIGIGIPNRALTPAQILAEVHNAILKLAHIAGAQFQRDITNLVQQHLLNQYLQEHRPHP